MPEEKPRSFDGVEPPQTGDHEKEKIERLRRAMYSRSLSPNIKERERRELDQHEEKIGEDWVRPERQLSSTSVAPRTIGTARSALKVLLWTAVAFFVGALGFFGYYFFLGGGSAPVSPGNIDISISGPLQVQSGSPTELQIAVVNRNRVALELADLVITYPKGTRSPSDLATDLPSQRISLGTIEPGGRRQGTVSALFSGIEGDRANIRVELEYRLQDSSAVFVANSNYQMVFSSSPLTLTIEGNNETTAGQPVQFTVNISSNAEAPVKDVILNASFPFGFSMTSAEPAQKSGQKYWSLGDINPGQKKSVVIRGVVNGESGDERVFRFTAGTRKTPQENTISAVLADYAHHLTVSNPFLGLAIRLNNDSGVGTTVVGPGDTVTVAVAYENNLAVPITDAIVVAQLSGIEIDGSTVRSNDGFYRSSDRVMLWDKSTQPELATLSAGARGTLNFSFQMPSSETLADIRDPKLTISVQAAGKRISENNVPETLQATTISTVRLASDLQLIAQGLFYSNPFGSTGAMPPKAGSETTYAIVFSLTNTTNEIENAIVRASLPPYVRWTGIFAPSTENITFNQNDGTITWRVGTVGANVGVAGNPPKQAAINIGFTPSTSQIGQQPLLVRNVTLTGKDAATGAAVSRTADEVTTNIVGDQGFLPVNATVVR